MFRIPLVPVVAYRASVLGPPGSSTDSSIVFWRRPCRRMTFRLLAPHLRTLALERGVMLYDIRNLSLGCLIGGTLFAG